MTNEPRPSILVVDDETSIRESFSMILQDQYSVFQAASGEAAVKKVVDTKIDLVFLDIRMPGIDGIETLRRIKDIDDSIEVVMVTAVNDIQKAAQAIQIGANNYIVKPFDIDQILLMTKALTGKKILKHETKVIRSSVKSSALSADIPGISKQATALMEQISSMASSDRPLIVSGEPGTQAQDVCRLIHMKSKRNGMPFRTFTVQKGLPDNIILDALTGSGKGSFLSAMQKGLGIFEEASGGSVLLMNIEFLSLQLQESIAEMVSKDRFFRQGSSEMLRLDVRLMFSASKDPKSLFDEGIISEKLYQLIKDSHLEIPPLRERKEDISPNITSIIDDLNVKYNRDFKEVSRDALEILSGNDWPGNTEELSLLLKMIVASRVSGIIRVFDLPFNLFTGKASLPSLEESRSVSFQELSSRFEKEVIKGVLKRSNFDLGKTASALNVSKNVLTSKMESLEIS